MVGAELSESVKNTLSTGDRILHLFDQPLYKTVSSNLQVYLFCVLWVGIWQGKGLEEMRQEVGKITLAYEKDKKVNEETNKFIESYDSFNKILADIKGHLESISPTETV